MILTHGSNSISRGGFPTSVDIGGKTYQVVKIGNQLWTSENLDYVWSGLHYPASSYETYGAAVYYNQNETEYGLLYNNLATTVPNLPDGWRVPSENDINTLITTIGGINAVAKLKSTSDWLNGNGTDDYGFNLKPSGRRCAPKYSVSNFRYENKGSIGYFYLNFNTYEDTKYVKIENDIQIISGYFTEFYPIRLVKDVT